MKTIELSGEIVNTSVPFAVSLDTVTVNISPVQSGSGDPSPTNVRPISGWTGANVVISPTTEAQDGTTYPISWQAEAETVYGGTLDVTTGVLTVNKRYRSATAFSGKSRTNANDQYIISVDAAAKTNAQVICNMAPQGSVFSSTLTAPVCGFADDTLNLFRFAFPKSMGIDTVDKANALISASELHYVYELATPQIYQLSPTDVDLLLGDNNIWADCGEIGIAYRPYHRFTFDGINSIDDDLYVFPTDSMVAAPARQYTEQVVPGRSGVLLMDDGMYDNILHEYQVVADDDGQANIALLRNMLASRVGYCRLTDTFDTDHYYMAAYNQDFTPVLEWRRRDMAKAMISFYRKPQRFLLSGESAVVLTASGSITNPTRFKAKPFIRVYGSGVLGIGDTNITIASHAYSYMDIDCETGRAYYGATSLDSKVTLNAIDFPSLAPGSNGITKGSGITRIEITPRWWEL